MLLSYSGEPMLTTDRLGEAVIEYARLLLAESRADVVEIPVVRDAGTSIARLVVGPMSQLLALPAKAGAGDVELNDSGAFAAIRSKLGASGHSRAATSDKGTWDEFALVYDFL